MKKENKESAKNSTRRQFIKSVGIAAAGFTIVPRHVLGGVGFVAPSDMLNIAGIGVGGMGLANLKHLKSQNIVALCLACHRAEP